MKKELTELFKNSEISEAQNFSSIKMLKIVYNELIKDNFKIEHLDSVIILQQPNVSRYVEEMQNNIINTFNGSNCTISIKATTTDNLGFIGEGKGIACQAVATLIKK